jgi:acyl-CoA reductase-like NAD-dependent aldehyde dehydrogenase
MTLNDIVAAREAGAQWGQISIKDRADVLRAIGRDFAERATDVVNIVRLETSKSALDAWFADIIPNIDLFTYWTSKGPAFLADEKAPLSALKFPGKKGVLRWEPRGLVGLITPWNYPVALALRNLVPALLAGNAVLFKPSEVTPKSGDLVAEIFNKHLPAHVLTVVHGEAEAGQKVVDEADHVIFIGSVETGRKVGIRCAEQLKSVSLELGGKDAAVVLADCDLTRTAQGLVWGSMSNSGQNCAAVERIYAENAIYEPLLTEMKRLTSQIEVAPVTTATQDAKIKAQLADAEAKGATLHGTYPGPVLITDVPEDAQVVLEETFGPLVVIVPVTSGEEGMSKANKSIFGLTTSIWTEDQAKAAALTQQAESGVVTVNNVAVTAAMPFAPWSGRGASGHGVTNSQLAIREMSQPKFVLTDSNRDPEVWWYPATTQAIDLARDTLSWLVATPFKKIGATIKVLGGIKRRLKDQKSQLSSNKGS